MQAAATYAMTISLTVKSGLTATPYCRVCKIDARSKIITNRGALMSVRGLPLNDVKQSGRQIEFGIRVAHASFQGTLNQEGTEIAGQLKHGQNHMPLTLRKQ
jgi:hypothetical protein